MELSQTQRTTLSQTQNLVQTIKISHILSLNRQELLENISEEFLNNPALQVKEKEKPEKEFSAHPDDNPRSYKLKSSGRINREAADAKQKFMENGIASEITLQDHLLMQLHLQPIPREWQEIGEVLISNLDNNGFHINEPQDIINHPEPELPGQIIRLIQSFDPPGTCTANTRESLIVQTRLDPLAPPEAAQVLNLYWELLTTEKYREISKRMQINEQQWQEIFDFIKTLNPYPGSAFSHKSTGYIVPDIIVKRKEGWFEISLNDDDFPVLEINPNFRNLLKESQVTRQDRRYIKKNINEANSFIYSLNYRNSTLLKVCRAIFEYQVDFFVKGPIGIAPLTLNDIAEEVELDASTISRVTKDKYIQTDLGIFAIKFFFANPITKTETGSSYSDIAVQFMIKEILDQNGSEKMTDQAITELLNSKGIDIKRKTVNNYRHKLLHN